ncbi:MAG: hypothetical protein K0R85_2555, partial [Devosia sp.]|nr:hypothetical protein [Devosia sp.]
MSAMLQFVLSRIIATVLTLFA